MEDDPYCDVEIMEEVSPPRRRIRQQPNVLGTPEFEGPPINESLQIVQDEPELAALIPAMLQNIERGCGQAEAQRFADSLRGGIDVGNEAVYMMKGLVRAIHKSLNLEDSEMTTQITSAVTAAVRNQRAMPASSVPTPQEKSTRRDMLSERLPALIKGSAITFWIDHVKAIIRQDGTGLSEAEILNAVRKAARVNTEVALSMDSATIADVKKFFVILTRLFKPNHIGYLAAWRAKRQKENQPAGEYITEIKDLGYTHWVGLPQKAEMFEIIINSMSDKLTVVSWWRSCPPGMWQCMPLTTQTQLLSHICRLGR
eukprot:jgi/Botrbrau1/793/Bobra.0181s0046.1